MRNRVVFASVMALVIGLFSVNLAAQVVPKSIREGGTDAALRERKNAGTVGIAGGLLSGTYMRFVDEMASVLNDGDNLRILPIVSYGAASNLDDLLYLRGVDAAVTQSDVFEYFRTQRKTPNLERRVQYIIRLPIAELHILARNDVQSLEDLRGKKVNFGPAGTGASLTGTIVFQRLGINVEQVLIDQPTALQKLQSGQVDAIARVIPKADRFLRQNSAERGSASGEHSFHQDFRGPLYARRVQQAGLPQSAAGPGSHRHDRRSRGACCVQLAEKHRSLRQGRSFHPISVQPLGRAPAPAVPSEMA